MAGGRQRKRVGQCADCRVGRSARSTDQYGNSWRGCLRFGRELVLVLCGELVGAHRSGRLWQRCRVPAVLVNPHSCLIGRCWEALDAHSTAPGSYQARLDARNAASDRNDRLDQMLIAQFPTKLTTDSAWGPGFLIAASTSHISHWSNSPRIVKVCFLCSRPDS